MVKLKGETFVERKKDQYKNRKIDQRNQEAFHAASMAVNDAIARYLNEMDTDRFDLLDVGIIIKEEAASPGVSSLTQLIDLFHDGLR